MAGALSRPRRACSRLAGRTPPAEPVEQQTQVLVDAEANLAQTIQPVEPPSATALAAADGGVRTAVRRGAPPLAVPLFDSATVTVREPRRRRLAAAASRAH